MCEVLGVSKSGYYNWLSNQDREPTDREKRREEIKQKVSQFFHQSFGTYGSPRIHSDLIDVGYIVSQKTVARLMKEMGLRATPITKYVQTTDSNHNYNIYPNLLNQGFTVDEPNAVWVTDITYIWTMEGWVYLASVMDLFSRKVVGWSQAAHMKTDLTLKALRMAITTRQPEKGLIHHSDRGSQYCSNDYIEELDEIKAEISMSRTGNPYDNACIESFHATIKKELIYRTRFRTRDEAIKAVNYYISNFYNERRKHSTLGYLSPNRFERLHDNSQNVIYA
jgi:putative transposase